MEFRIRNERKGLRQNNKTDFSLTWCNCLKEKGGAGREKAGNRGKSVSGFFSFSLRHSLESATVKSEGIEGVRQKQSAQAELKGAGNRR